MGTPVSTAPDPHIPCQTRIHYTALPSDLVTWGTAAFELSTTPHPIPERTLRRKFTADGRRRTWRMPGVRGELVSMSDVFAFQRDLVNGWLVDRQQR
jgi:hypothetical protein